MKNFEYIRPNNLDDAISAFNEYEDAFLMAGGTDILVGIKYDLVTPRRVIDLKGIPSMSSFEYQDVWKFGALTTVRDLEMSETLRQKLPFLCQAAGSLGSVQIRNRATIGGNLCNASPAADVATSLLTMDARVRIVSDDSEKLVALEDFFIGPNSTILARGEILTEIIIPREIEHSDGLYIKFGPRKAMDIGLVNVAVLLDGDLESRLCNKIRIGLGAVAPTPIRASSTSGKRSTRKSKSRWRLV